MTAKPRLEADRAELVRFVEATFRYADDGTAAILRTFAEGSSEVLGSVRVPLNGTGLDALVDHAARPATKAANAARPSGSRRWRPRWMPHWSTCGSARSRARSWMPTGQQ